MRKTIKCLFTISFIVFVAIFVGCSNQVNTTTTNTRDNTTIINNETITEDAFEKVYHYLEYCDYSEDLAWVNFTDEANYYWGCIDKNGKLVFCFDSENIKEITSFSNGFSYVICEDKYIIIDKQGNVIGEYKCDENNAVLAYGDGNIFIRQKVVNYESCIYNYSIINSKGITVKEFSLDELKDYYGFEYFGNGVFGYYTEPWKWNIYFPEVKKWIKWNAGGNGLFYFESDKTTMGIEYGGGYDTSDGFRGRLHIIDTKGNITKIKIPKNLGWDWSNGGSGWSYDKIVENKYVLYEFSSEYMILFDVSNKEFYKMPEKYVSNIEYEKLSNALEFNNGRIALPWIGNDGYNYVALFDTNWNLINEPMQLSNFDNYIYSDGMLIIFDNGVATVYDKNYNKIYDFSEYEFSNISGYKNGVIKKQGENKPLYLDKKGIPIFDNIDMSILS